MNLNRILLLFGLIVGTQALQSCAPNHARTNARIEKGFNAGITGSVSSTSKDSINHEHQRVEQFEANLGFSGGRQDNNLGFSMAIKAGAFSFPGVELYVEMPSEHPFYYGFGVELGLANGGYAIGSYYFAEEFFVSITGRVLAFDDQAILNPQLSIGSSRQGGSPSVSLFSGYQHYSGRGLNLDTSWGASSANTGYADQLIYGGLSVQF